MDKKTALISTIEFFEKGKLNLQQAKEKIVQLTGRDIDEYAILNYWTHTSLDNFCDIILTEAIIDWQNIDDQTSLILIKEMIQNITNDSLLEKNREALEKKYRKPSGLDRK